MKKNCCEFISERNENLRREFYLRVFPGYPGVLALFEDIARIPAPRFYISEERAISLLCRKKRLGDSWGRGMVPSRRAMIDEIDRRVRILRSFNPGLTLKEAVFRVVNSPAPSFYLTPNSIRSIIYRKTS